MNDVWPTRTLSDIADIRVSNVDKKIFPTELPVKLCNYMDVYANDYITREINFSQASASIAEIRKFALQRGDVIITKDSETPDDIGIPAVVLDDIMGLVCGYHLCLIRPNNDGIDSIYLAKQLATSKVARYFAVHATGSTRFGLSFDTIEKVELPVPPKPEQTKIAEILSTVDQAIEQTEALIVKQQRIKTGLMKDLLTRGILPVGKLRPPREEAPQLYKDSPLGWIPKEWGIQPLSEVAQVDRGKFTHRPRNDPRFYGGEFPFIQTGDITSRTGRVVKSYTQSLNKRGTTVSKEFPAGTIAISIAANIADTAILGIPMYFPDSVVGAVVSSPNNVRFIELMIRNWKPVLEHSAPQSAQKNINLETLRPLPIPTPVPDEQRRIGLLYDVVDASQEQLEQYRDKLFTLKTGLMQDLLTGTISVTPLLKDVEVGQ